MNEQEDLRQLRDQHHNVIMDAEVAEDIIEDIMCALATINGESRLKDKGTSQNHTTNDIGTVSITKKIQLDAARALLEGKLSELRMLEAKAAELLR